MPAKTIYPAKIIQPLNRKAVLRERLFKQLNEAREHATVIWLSAPGGAGKTTLVSSYLNESKSRSIWYQVDSGDSDPATFFHFLGLAGKREAPRRKSKLPALTPEYLEGLTTYTRRFFEDIASRLGDDGVLVLDNFQELDEDNIVAQLLDVMAESVQGHITIIVVSRSRAPAKLAGMLAKRQLLEIGMESIRFDKAEWLAVANQLTLTHDNKLLFKLHKKMDGWVSGLLLCQSADLEMLDKQDGPQAAGAPLFNYFAHEFFQRLDEPSQHLLIHCAFLSHFSEATASTVSGIDNCSTILRTLVSRNVFIQRQGVGLYTLHPLFQSYLKVEARQQMEDAEINQLMQISAESLEALGEYESAAELYIRLGLWQPLTKLILAHSEKMYQQGRITTLQLWLQSLPDTMAEKYPWLNYWQATLLGLQDVAASLEKLDLVFEHFLIIGDEQGAWQTWLLAMEQINSSWRETGKLSVWLNRYQQCRNVFADSLDFTLEAKLAANLAQGYMLSCHDPDKTEFWLDQLDDFINRCVDTKLLVLLLTRGLYTCIIVGFVNRAQRYLAILNESSSAEDMDPLLQINVLTIRMFGETFIGDTKRCLELYKENQKLSDRYGIYLFEGICQSSALTSALSLGEQGKEQADQHFSRLHKVKDLAPINELSFYFGASRYMIDNDRVDEAVLASKKFIKVATETAPIPAYALIARFTLFEGYRAQGNMQQAFELLEGIATEAKSLHLITIQIRASMVRARLAAEMKDEVSVHQYLTEFFALGKCYGMHFGSGWPPVELISWLCVRALELNIETDFVRSYIRPRINKLIPPGPELEPWPWPVRIYTLGGFRVELDDGSYLDESKQNSPPLQLLIQLISRSGVLDTQTIVESLYPDLIADKRLALLRKHLHRLRQLLGDEESILREGDTLRINNKYCWLDVDAFNALLKQDGEKTIKRAQALYQGEFMPQESRNNFEILTRREHLRSAYLHMVLERLGNLTGEEAISHCHKVLQIEPLSEIIYQKLMQLYHQIDRADLAVVTYEQCRRILHAELGIEPMADSRQLAGIVD